MECLRVKHVVSAALARPSGDLSLGSSVVTMKNKFYILDFHGKFPS